MKLIINSPTQEISHQVAWLEINTPTGNYVIQKGHVPTLMMLATNQPLTYRLQTGKEEAMLIEHGFVTIDRESARIIAVFKTR